MSDGSQKKPLRRTIRGGRPFFFEDTAIDKVLNMVVTLGSEVWALRERLAAVEGLQVQRGHLGEGEVDGYEFTAEQESRLAADRKEFIDNLFRVLQEQVEKAAAKSESARALATAEPAVFGARGAKGKPAPSRARRGQAAAPAPAKVRAKRRARA
ncbi:MAG: hypothetical protein MUF07_17605 [Steroidobacteraceae bacterium]|jgi:hypothetical protein|nr:hypothetical protein [Steroidobacteraceae bacterium]